MSEVASNKLYVVAWTDPAGALSIARRPGHLARSSIVVIGMDAVERIFVLSVWAQRCPTDRLVERVFQTNTLYRPAMFGLDSTGAGGLIFYELLLKEARQRAAKINFRPMAMHEDKTFSIERTLQPVAAQGRLFRPLEEDCRILKEEWTTFPDGQYRDVIDALACAIRLLPAVLPEHMRQMTREALRRYLERTGMKKDQVELRLQQRDQYNPVVGAR